MAISLFFNGFWGIQEGALDRKYLDSLEEDGKNMIFLFPSAGVSHTMGTLALLKDKSISNKLLKAVIIGFLLFDFILIISSAKRTVVLLFISYIIYYIWNERALTSLKKFISFIPVIIFVILLIHFAAPHFTFLADHIDRFVERLTSGIDTLFGLDKNNYDESANDRVETRAKAFKIFENFSYLNYIFGSGYMTMYMDQPLLQCYFDMGLIGIFVYVYNDLIAPFKYFIRRTKDPNLFLFKLYWINIGLTCLSSGIPYGYYMYAPSLFIFFSNNVLRRRRQPMQHIRSDFNLRPNAFTT